MTAYTASGLPVDLENSLIGFKSVIHHKNETALLDYTSYFPFSSNPTDSLLPHSSHIYKTSLASDSAGGSSAVRNHQNGGKLSSSLFLAPIPVVILARGPWAGEVSAAVVWRVCTMRRKEHVYTFESS